MWAETISPGQGFAAIHTGAPSALLQRLCVSAEEAGAYYLALTADMDESGDGRLSAGDGWLAAVRPPARSRGAPATYHPERARGGRAEMRRRA